MNVNVTYESTGWTLVGPNRLQRFRFLAYADGVTALFTYPDFKPETPPYKPKQKKNPPELEAPRGC